MNIFEQAKDAGFIVTGGRVESPYIGGSDIGQRLKEFAALVRAEALEEAAKVCEKRIGGAVQNNEWWSGFRAAMKQCAAAIRGLK